ncbi:MAG: hypothetical protein AB1414_05255 [bacterium]
MIVKSSKGIKIFGWLTIFLAILLILAILLGKPSKPVSVSERCGLGIIAVLVMFVGIGILKHLNLARVIFIVFSFLLSFGAVSVLIQRISEGKLDIDEVILTACFLAFTFLGSWYFTRPSVKAEFKGAFIDRLKMVQYIHAFGVDFLLAAPIGALLVVLFWPFYLYSIDKSKIFPFLTTSLLLLVFIWIVFYFSAYFLLKTSKKFYMDINSIRKIHKRVAIGIAIFTAVYAVGAFLNGVHSLTSKEIFKYSCLVISYLIIAIAMDKGLFDKLLNHGIQRVSESE